MSELPETLAGVSGVDCTGLQALVTGSTSDIGHTAALALGRLGADVVLAGVLESSLDAALGQIDNEVSRIDGFGVLELLKIPIDGGGTRGFAGLVAATAGIFAFRNP